MEACFRIFWCVYRRISLYIVARGRRIVAISFDIVCIQLPGLVVDRAYIAAWRLHIAVRRIYTFSVHYFIQIVVLGN